MSLFSLVQGRIPAPMPQAAPPARQQMAAPVPGMMPPDPNAPPPMMPAGRPSAPGFAGGGMLGFEADYNPMVVDNLDDGDEQLIKTGPQGFDAAYAPLMREVIPMYWTGGDVPTDNPNYDPNNPNGGDGMDITPDLAQIMAGLRRNDAANGVDQSSPTYDSDLMLTAQGILEQQNYDRSQDAAKWANSGGGGSGPDHFYEQLAYDAQQAAQQRRDAQQMANIQQQNDTAAANQAYKSALVSADADRKQVMNNAIGQAQDSYAKLLSQADPEQGALWRRPSQGVEAIKQTQGPTWAPPTLPQAVFPEGWA